MAQQETRPPEQSPPGDPPLRDEGATSGGDGQRGSVAQELRQAIREAAIEVLGPAARQAATSAARYAVSKGPELVAKNLMPGVSKGGAPGDLAERARSKGAEALSGIGGIGGIAGKLLSKLARGRGGGAATGWGRNRRMPVQQHIYVSVPIRDAYNGWTEYKQWPRYMHRANQVDAQIDDREARVKVTEKMWGFKRPFTAEVVTQRPDEQIKWNATEGTKHTGVINFHELGPRLTFIEVNVDHAPSGPLEKLARGARYVKRAVRADFHRYQAWIEMKSTDELAELDGWRGTIEDGQIVTSHEEAVEAEQREGEGQDGERARDGAPQAREDREEQPEAAGQDKRSWSPPRASPEAPAQEEADAAGREEAAAVHEPQR